MDGAPSFGEALRRYRMAAALSQEDLADRAGLSARGVSDLERGARTAPRLETVRLLAGALGLDDAERAVLLAARGAATTALAEAPLAAGGERPLLPAPPTPFFGRDHDVDRVQTMFLDGRTRLVTLTGPGGVGKTHLAIVVAKDVSANFAGGVAFVSLAPVSDPALVPPAIARQLGVGVGSGDPAHLLPASIGDRALLLILDNFEHVLPAAPFVAELLASCPHLSVLATSRERLRLSGERIFPVAPLAVPLRAAAPAGELLENPAVQLFVERALAVDPDLDLSAEDAAAIAEICRRVDGLPLAIELAAAQVDVLPPPALLAHMERRLPFLVGGARDAPERHRTLRDAITWSHDLLNPAEQALFRHLAVFAGGWTVEAAGAVADAGTGTATTEESTRQPPLVFDALAALVAKNLVQRATGPGAEPRFAMLETIREFAGERLSASGEEDRIRRAHAAYVAGFMTRARQAFEGPGRLAAMDRVEADYANARTAIAWAVERGEVEIALRLAGALWPFWLVRVPMSEARQWAEATIALGGEPGWRIEALYGAFALAYLQGDASRATVLAEELLSTASGIDHDDGAAKGYLARGLAAGMRDAADKAEALREAVARFRALDDQSWLALALGCLGHAANQTGDRVRAKALFEESLGIYRGIENEWGIAAELSDLGLLALDGGDPVTAAPLLGESLRRSWEQRDRWSAVQSMASITHVLAQTGKPEQAARLFAAAERLRERVGFAVSPATWAAFEQELDRIRHALGDQAFAAAWEAGLALTPDEAISDALAAVESVASPSVGQPVTLTAGLSPRELEVLRLIAAGRSNQQIADALSVSRRTATTHATNILNKLGLDSRAELIAFAFRHGLA